jgi:hypothetical protein
MFFLVTPNAVVNVDHIDCVRWDSVPRMAGGDEFVAYVSFESGKKEKLVGSDAEVLRQKYEALAVGARILESSMLALAPE